MKIWERTNEIKGINASEETILDWMMLNRVCPLIVADCLEEGEQPDLGAEAAKHCEGRDCSSDCYREFLERSV